jgi:hypothetical protein
MDEDLVLNEKQRRLIEACWIIRLFGWLAFGVSVINAGYLVFVFGSCLYYRPTPSPPGGTLQYLAEACSSVIMGLMAVGLSQLVPYLFGLFSRPPRLVLLFPWFAFAKAGFVVIATANQVNMMWTLQPNIKAGLALAMGWMIAGGFVSVVFFIGLGLLVKYSLPLLDDARAMV